MSSDANIIEGILSNFDFDKVADAMRKLDWHWASSKGVPSTREIIVTATELLDRLSTDRQEAEPGTFLEYSTGGLHAQLYVLPKDGRRLFTLQFVLEEWDNYE